MEMIQKYHEQESQSSSSCDDLVFVNRIENVGQNNVQQSRFSKRLQRAQPQLPNAGPQQQNGANGRRLQQNADRLRPNRLTHIAQWLPDINRRVHSCLGCVNELNRNRVYETMDYFIRKLTQDFDLFNQPKIAAQLADYIRTFLFVCRYLYRSYVMGKRYYKRIVKILAIYTDMELFGSIRGTEYDAEVVDRMQYVYHTNLEINNHNMVLDVLLTVKRLSRHHRGILSLLLQHFLFLSTPTEFVDILYIKNVIMFKRWLYIEEVEEEREQIRDAFVTYVKPMKTIGTHPLFKPLLPIDARGCVQIENVLNSHISIISLTHAMKAAEQLPPAQTNGIAEEHIEPQPEANIENVIEPIATAKVENCAEPVEEVEDVDDADEVIVMPVEEVVIVINTDDEDEDKDKEDEKRPMSPEQNSNSHDDSHLDDLSYDFDIQSPNSSQPAQTSPHNNMAAEVPSTNTIPSQSSAPPSDMVNGTTQSQSETVADSVNDGTEDSTTAQSHNVPSPEATSMNDSNDDALTSGEPILEAAKADKMITVLSDELITGENIFTAIAPMNQSTFDHLVNNINQTQIEDSFLNVVADISFERLAMPSSSVESQTNFADMPPMTTVTRHETSCQATIVLPLSQTSADMDQFALNGNGMVTSRTDEYCDTANANENANGSISNTSLSNHEETLLQIDEILLDDLNGDLNRKQTPDTPSTSNSSIIEITESPTKSGNDQVPIVNDSLGDAQRKSRAEQEIDLDEDEEANEIVARIFGSESSDDDEESSRASTSSIDDEPPMWLQNHRNNPPRTYSKKNKDLSYATPQPTASTSKVNDEDSFLMDIFCSNDIRDRLTDMSHEPTETDYIASTPRSPSSNHCEVRTKRKPVRANGDEIQRVPSLQKRNRISDPTSIRTRNEPKNSSLDDVFTVASSSTLPSRRTYGHPMSDNNSDASNNSFADNSLSDKLHSSSMLYSSSSYGRSNGNRIIATKKKSTTILDRKSYSKHFVVNSSIGLPLQTFDTRSNSSSSVINFATNAPKSNASQVGAAKSNDIHSSKGIRNPISGLKLNRSFGTPTSKQKRPVRLSDGSDGDDSSDANNRKSTRSRKRPKKLDL